MQMTVRERQRHLKRHGFYGGRIDGIDGPKTRVATIAFKTSRGLRARDFVGPITAQALRKGIKPAPARARIDGRTIILPAWMRLAYGYLGLKEIPGPSHNADILAWWQRLDLNFRDDETPWCAGFANAMIQAAGLPIAPGH